MVWPCAVSIAKHVHFFARHFRGALQEIARGADGGADAQAAVLVFCGVGKFDFFLDVFYGDQALEVEIRVDYQKFFDAMALQDFFGFLESGSHGNGDEIVLGHHRADGLIEIAFETQIAISENAHEARAARDGQARHFVLVHDVERLADGKFRRDSDGINDHAAFRAFYAVHFLGLAVNGHVAMDEADAALAGDGDGQARVRDCVHGRGDDRNVERNFAREAGARVRLRWQYRRFARQQQHVVESQRFGDGSFNHLFSYESEGLHIQQSPAV